MKTVAQPEPPQRGGGSQGFPTPYFTNILNPPFLPLATYKIVTLASALRVLKMTGPGEITAFVLVSDESHLAVSKKQSIWKGLQDLGNSNQ